MHMTRLLAVTCAACALTASPVLCAKVANVGLAAMGAHARSWETGAHLIPEHEPAKANDGSFHSYWEARPEELPADLGLEWPQPQKISTVVVRYFNGRMVRGPAVARTQEWARLQAWDGSRWSDIDARIYGQETSGVRYEFSPVTTTRIRLLFTEPPDPEGRRAPERLGIFVCELEAYEQRPFQTVSSPGRLVKVLTGGDNNRDYQRFYNEPPSGDAGYDFSGPLVIEPKQTRIFSDTLTPTLIVAESRWAREQCAAERRADAVLLANGFLQLELSTAGGLKEKRLTNRVTGEAVATPDSQGFVLRTSTRRFTPAGFKTGDMDAGGSGGTCHANVALTSPEMDVTVHYELRQADHFYHKWLTVSNKGAAAVQILDASVSALELPRPVDLMAGQELTYPVSQTEKGGFFSCLETIYWDHKGDTLTYYPGASLAPGGSFQSEKAAVGVLRKRGDYWRGWDRGIREWVTEYHVQISPAPNDWPDVYSEGWSVKVGVEELVARPEWSERVMSLAEKLGIRYMDAYEPAHQAAVMPPDLVKRFVDLAGRHQVNTGWWIDFGSDAPWGTGAPLKPFACLLSPEAEQYLKTIVDLTRTYKLRAMHWADFFSVFECPNTNHGHLPGKQSIYAQGQRMLRFGQQLREASPGIMLGADGGFTNPQYVRYLDSRAHGTFYGGYEGDHFSAVEPDLHIDRLYADMNRVYEHGSRAVFLRPWYRMLNCVNHYGQETHSHDRAGYRYSLLSAIAMAGQVTYNDVPDQMPESEIQFTQRWLNWAKQNRDYLKQTDKLFERSVHFADVWQGDAESLSGFAHIRGDRGYVFLLNPGAVEQVAQLTLALDAPASARFAVNEVFPGGMSLRGPEDGRYAQGGKVTATVPAKQVRVLWIGPETGAPQKLQPEDSRAAQYARYVGGWSLVKQTADSAMLTGKFEFPAAAAEYLKNNVPETDWAKEPWAFDKAYLVFLLKDETQDLNNNWIADSLLAGSGTAAPASVSVNGTPRSLHAFKTGRNQREHLTRGYFIQLQNEIKPGAANEVEITLPIRTGLVFSGAYIDLPDQMPLGE
jgi:hypothetical protein